MLTLPKALAGIWAGTVRWIADCSAGEDFIILPTEEHFIRVSDDIEFFLEFCR